MSVKVAVRVRPFNQKEIDSHAELCINMNGQTTIIKDDFKKEKSFSFDYSFWSHDDFVINQNGYVEPQTERYYDQQKVFNCMGKEILDNAWEGYNCCLFAYGQTGSGKSYSMVGYGANKGIVPISCEEIFDRIKSNTITDKLFEVMVSMLEIYNEKVQDLLIPINKRPSSGLKVRESKTIGVFVDSLSKHPVITFDEIAKKMDEGYQNRTIGSTLMNATSSRAHTIVTIEFKQIQSIMGKKSEKISVINLVDLAGSERLGSTGATGDRLKEGCNINKSLLALGNVINALADKETSKKKEILPPYRDSVLTRILQNALGGNSKTVMICALSPSNSNYEETLSTLRYADRVKKIKNKAVVNQSDYNKLIRLLKEENNDLKKMIEDLNRKIILSGGMILDEDRQNFLNLKEQYDATCKVMIEMEKTFEEKLNEAKVTENRLIDSKFDISSPHLVVLNEDPQLSHKLKYSLKQTPIFIGRKYGNPSPLIILSGIGIKVNHAKIIEINHMLKLIPCDKEAEEYIFINGRKLASQEGVLLKNKDRITFGTNSIFLYMEKSDGNDINSIDWDIAQNELHNEIKEIQRAANDKKKKEEIKQMKRELEIKFNKEKEELEQKFNKQIDIVEKQLKKGNQNAEKFKFEVEKMNFEKEYHDQLKVIESSKIVKKIGIENKEKNIFSNSKEKEKFNKENKIKLEKTLRSVVRKLNKLRIICSEFKRNITFDINLLKEDLETKFSLAPRENLPDLCIKVQNFEEGTVYYWSTETFYKRYYMMKELFERYQEEDIDVINIINEDDPLWDESKRKVLGYCFYNLEPLAFLLNNESISTIVSTDRVLGYLLIDMIPIKDENPLKDNENPPDDPYELIGTTLEYLVYIKEIKDLPINFCKDIQVEYECFHDKDLKKTKIISDKSGNLVFETYFKHKINYVQKEDIDYLLKENICFRLTGLEEVEKKGKFSNKLRNSNIYLDNSYIIEKSEKKLSNNGLESLKSYTNFKASTELDIDIIQTSVPKVISSIPIKTSKDMIVKSEFIYNKNQQQKEKKNGSTGCKIF